MGKRILTVFRLGIWRNLLSLTVVLSIAAYLPIIANAQTTQDTVHHDLEVTIDPVSGEMQVRDTITLPDTPADEPVEFLLNSSFALTPEPRDADIGINHKVGKLFFASHPAMLYQVQSPNPIKSFTIKYQGNLWRHKGVNPQELIEKEGIYLDNEALWFPLFSDRLVDFTMHITLPSGWRAVSQGELLTQTETEQHSISHWRETQAQETIWLVANRFHWYRDTTPQAQTMAYLLQPDMELAQRYLAATRTYLDMYSRLLGDYPYAKFALVENPCQTGYGMPSFTLLGSRVIRLPFILTSSYPHEILHNWWGNGVYPDYEKGNWSEGLTAYLADHLIAEQQGRGIEYRRTALQKHADYVNEQRDFPLHQFRSRHDDASQAIGYHKALMFFHSLRQRFGDQVFINTLRRFYMDNRFQKTTWKEVQHAFESESGEDLTALFKQWLERTGAPLLSVSDVKVQNDEIGPRLSGVLQQEQDTPAFAIRVPITISLEQQEKPYQTVIDMTSSRQAFALALPQQPTWLQVDAGYDVFRHLHPAERPPSLGQVFGAESITAVIPSKMNPAMQQGLRQLLQSWQQRYPQIRIVSDETIDVLPDSDAIWLFGWENRFVQNFKTLLQGYSASLKNDSIEISGQNLQRETHAIVLTTQRMHDNSRQTIAWLGNENIAALPGLGRKLTHYGRYGYLAFEGDSPDNMLKGEWPVINSPLIVPLSEAAVLPPPANHPLRQALIKLPPDN